MGDAAAQQQQKRAFFASFPPTGDKSMNVVSDVHRGSIRTVPLGKIENVVRTDTVPLAVLMNRVGCQVAFQVDFSICFGKAVELCFEGGGGGDIPDAMPLLQHDALSNWQQLGAIVYNTLVKAATNASDASEPDDVATGGGQQRQLVRQSFLDALARSTDWFVSFLARQPGGEAYLGRVYTKETDGLGNMFSNIRYVSPPSPLLSLSLAPIHQSRLARELLPTHSPPHPLPLASIHQSRLARDLLR